jgi:formate C-acetyltransferase
MRQRIRDGEQKRWRHAGAVDLLPECEAERLSWMRRTARLTRRMCEAQQVVITPDERIVFTRTTERIPPIGRDGEWRRTIPAGTPAHASPINNICPDWGLLLSHGLLGRRRVAIESRERLKDDPSAVEFLDAAIETMDAVLALAARYALDARRLGRLDIAKALEWVPARAPRSFAEALQSIRLCHSVLWLSGHAHCGLGRLDQYLWPYLKADLESGRLDVPQAEEWLAEFFISLNKDSDLYPGVQKGDNGQTVMLGGVKPDGCSAVNELTWLTLRVARDAALIDPKINLRIDSRTDPGLLTLAAELTRLGLGFPQYANDDVVIPGLVKSGYALEDARNYTVAACWEFIIPGRGMEVVNIGAVSFPAATDLAIRTGLAAGESFAEILDRTRVEIRHQVQRLADDFRGWVLPPAPYYSVLMDGCLERGRDLSCGLTYNNFGIHGAGSANAADALAAVKTMVFDTRTIRPADLLQALDRNYQGAAALRRRMQQDAPKVGNNDDRADCWLKTLFDFHAEACAEAGGNGRGGRFRPGSGSAMYYVWLTRGQKHMREPLVSTTADGRKAGDFFSSSLAPSPGIATSGPFSALQSFAKIDYSRICNGGPITMELSDTVFRGADGPRKVALLIQAFARLGGQQLQLNTLNVETLQDARLHPERHRNLIVRVWGWSGYFCELAPEYQEQIMARHVFEV